MTRRYHGFLQPDRLAFRIGFEAVQCRHDADDGLPIGTLPEADDGNDAGHHN